MTHPEARRRAVEAAALWLAYEMSWSDAEARYFVEGVMRESERAMADAGWRMVRVPGEKPHMDEYVPGANSAVSYAIGHTDGWNACRAKMLEDAP